MHPDGYGIRCREHFAQSDISAESATDTDKGTVRWVARKLLFLEEDGFGQEDEEIRMIGRSG